jgi:hypothetical protein
MGKPHPIELRVRVVAFVEEGNSHRVMERKEPTTGAPSDMSGAPSRPTFTLIVPVDGSMVGRSRVQPHLLSGMGSKAGQS